MTARRYAHGLLAALLALTFLVAQERTPAQAQDPSPYLTSWEVWDEYGRLRIQPTIFFGDYPSQTQIVFVAPGIRKVKIKPHWEGSGISVAVATHDMSRNQTLSRDTITTSGTASSLLDIAPGGGTKLNISVTKGSQTTVYSKKYLTREWSAANADNYLNSMGVTPDVSPNPNARESFRGERDPGQLMSFTPAGGDQQAVGSVSLMPLSLPTGSSYLRIAPGGGTQLNISIPRGSQTTAHSRKVLVREWSAAMGISPIPNARENELFRGERSPGQFASFTRAGLGQQAGTSITLTPTFDPDVQEYSATVPYAVSSVIVNPVPSHSEATATVNGKSPSTPVSLAVGKNVITVVVTAESGVQRTYTLTITRASLADDTQQPTATPTQAPTATPTPTTTSTPTPTATVTPTPTSTPTQEPAQQTPQERYADLIADMKEWRDDPCCASNQEHTDRWDQALLAFGETVADATLTPMTAAEAQGYADRGWQRWVDVAAALRAIESAGQQQPTATPTQTPTPTSTPTQEPVQQTPQERYADLIADMKEWRDDPCCTSNQEHTDRWDQALLAFGETVADATLTPMTAAEAQGYADRGWQRWVDVAAALRAIESAGQQQPTATPTPAPTNTPTPTQVPTNTPTQAPTNTPTPAPTHTPGAAAENAPTVSAPLADVSLAGPESRAISLSGVFHDPDGDSLTIRAVSSNYAVVSMWLSADSSTLTVMGTGLGTATITVTAEDADGHRVSDTFDVSVTVAAAEEESARGERRRWS